MKEYAPLAPIILALGGIASTVGLILPRRAGYIYSIAVLAFVQLFAVLAILDGFIYTVVEGGSPIVYMMGGWPPPIGITYVIDSFGFTIALVVLIAGLISLLVYWSSVWPLGSKITFQVFALIIQAGLLGSIFTSDFFHLFVMWEVVSISSAGLMLIGGLDRKVVNAAFRYAISATILTSLYMLIVVFCIYGSYGTLSMVDYVIKAETGTGLFNVTGGVAGDPELATGLLLATMVLLFGFAAGLFPLYFWMPDLYERISPAVAILLAGGKEIVAVYVIARNIYTIHLTHPYADTVLPLIRLILLSLGVAGAICGAFSLLATRNLKRMLAYYLVMDVGLIFATLSSGNAYALEAFIYLSLNHLVVVVALFSLSSILGEKSSRSLLPFAALAASGIPPFSSFMGKMLALRAFLDKPEVLAIFVLAVASTIAPLIAILRIQRSEKTLEGSDREHKLVSTVLVTVGLIVSLVLGLLVLNLKNMLLEPVSASALNTEQYIRVASERALEIYEKYWPYR